MSWPLRIATLSKGVRLFPQASAGWDFVRGAYKNAAGYVRTNRVPNPTSSGATLGVVGAGGALPTGWQVSYNPGGVTVTVTSVTASNGAPGVTVRVTGTLGGASQLNIRPFSSAAVVSAASGETWTAATDVALVAGGFGSGGPSVAVNENNGSGVYLTSSGTNYTPSAAPTRVWHTRTLNNASTAYADFNWVFALPTGAVDFTVSLGTPQFEKTAYPTSFLVGTTTTYASTNPADVGNMTFTRASTGYAEDAQGNLVLFGSNVPRITNKGVLIEPAATQMVTSPNDPNTSWAELGTTGASAGLSSDSAFTARTVASGGQYWHRRTFSVGSVTSGSAYSVTAWYRAGTSGKIYVEMRNAANSAASTVGGPVGSPSTLDQSAGTISNVSTTAFSNGRYRTTFQWTPNFTGVPNTSGAGPYSNTTGETVILEGVQVEAGSVPTSLIPSGTRAADVFYYTGLSVSASTLSLVGSGLGSTGKGYAGRIATLSDGANGDVLTLATDDSIRLGMVSSAPGISLQGLNNAPAVNAGSPTIGAISVAGGAVRGSANGSTAGAATGTYSYSGSLTQLYVGNNAGFSRAFTGYTQRIALYPYAANDTELTYRSTGSF